MAADRMAAEYSDEVKRYLAWRYGIAEKEGA